MNARSWLVVTVGIIGLGCAGLIPPDPTQIAGLEAALTSVDAANAPRFLVQGSVEAGSVRFGCAKGLGALAELDPAMRATLIAATLSDWKSFCPPTCVGSIADLGPMEPEERLHTTLERCDAQGPDPVFGGPLAPLRSWMAPLDYVVARKLTEIADASSPTFSALHPKLAVGLVLQAAPEATPSAEFGAHGSREVDPASFASLRDAVQACGPEATLAHRVVLDPEGKLAGFAGPSDNACVVAALEALALPPPDGGYTVLDLAWKPPAPAAPIE